MRASASWATSAAKLSRSSVWVGSAPDRSQSANTASASEIRPGRKVASIAPGYERPPARRGRVVRLSTDEVGEEALLGRSGRGDLDLVPVVPEVTSLTRSPLGPRPVRRT